MSTPVDPSDREGWAPPFSAAEYSERWDRVRAEMARRDIDTLIVTSPPNLTYLANYDSIWYDLTVVTAFVVHAAGGEPFLLDSGYHQMLARVTAVAPEIVYHRGRGTRALVGNLGKRGWLDGRVGIERWSRAPAGPMLAEIEAGLREAGAEVVDGSWLVDHVRLVMSPQEIAYVRRAAAIADAGMEAVRAELRPGLTEIQVQGIAHYAMAMLGGEEPAIRTVVRSGPRAGARHALPSERVIQPHEIVDVDFSASCKRYHVNIDRTFATGDVDDRWHDLLQRAAGSIERVVASVRPGDPMRKVADVGGAYIREAGLSHIVRWVDGYTIGVSIPPDWVGHIFLGGGRFEESTFEPGMVANYEDTFDVVHEDWPGGHGAAYIDTLLMTGQGLEVLSKLERTLIVV